MALQLYNSLTKQEEVFKPKKDREVTMYTCGPTVYGYQHIGNYRSYLSWDLLKRTLEFMDYKVNHVMNITDVGHLTDDDVLSSDEGEDKMEKAAKKENKTVWDIAKYYEEDFLEGLEMLHVKLPQTICRATDHIEGMIKMIEQLIEKGYAYVTDTGVYFDISTFEEYGELSGNTLDQLQAGASGRVEELEDKKSPHDFALWVLGKEQSMMWDSPWGRGYPGWHIECSAMSSEYLGDQIDIHTGGIDNKFPHHECEIAQSEGASGKVPFVKYWVHGAHMTVDGQKMAKSLGNVYLLKDLVEKGYSMRVYRYAIYAAHYRSSMDISFTALDEAKKNLETIDRFTDRLRRRDGEGDVSREVSEYLNVELQNMLIALESDINTPELFAELFVMMKEVNAQMDAGAVNAKEAQAMLSFLETIDEVVGVILPWDGFDDEHDVPEEILKMAEEREEARKNKDYAAADDLRVNIEANGYSVEDTQDGPIVRKM